MKRRKYLVGLGSLAAGSAAAMGTGAFNFANIQRDVSLNVVDDANALLALDSESDYADTSGGTLSLNFESPQGGMGINENSDYSFTSLFYITNQGEQSVGVWIDDDSNDVNWYGTANANSSDFSTSIEGPGNAYTLGSGNTVYVNMEVLGQGGLDEITSINVKADASQG
ncbi:DUF1102 domain-containing protein [Haloprofundus sp. MHR1]|uniref:DUF1102 domain-containing protein n=1 Tax=Haloprofundus sp. MHR1 TaxID=2572921 RepID=UPI0010BEA19D|nr:DUF1102 domain-containing protein [Haloprofundus sp. MHR1]QCJ48232.1 DUF1102 domain-containing protein [Haloprofundus sp. MHR1]